MWRNILDVIHVSELRATECLPAGQLDFYDRMFEVWADDSLNLDKDDSYDSVLALDDSPGQIGPRTLVRGKSHVLNDMVLFEAEFI